MIRRKFYHVTTLDADHRIQTELTPRVPENLMPTEDGRTERISIAPTIIGCLRGLPNHFNNVKNHKDFLVYKFTVNLNDPELIDYQCIYKDRGVNDALLTHEYWYLDKIYNPSSFVYQVSEVKLKKYFFASYDKLEMIKRLLTDCGVRLPRKYQTPYDILNEFLPKIDPVIRMKVLEGLEEKKYNDDDINGGLARIIYQKEKYEPPCDIIRHYVEQDRIYTCKIKEIK